MMKDQEKYISKKEASSLLQKSTRQVDRYARDEKWKFCYKKGKNQRKEKFYHLEDVEAKALELGQGSGEGELVQILQARVQPLLQPLLDPIIEKLNQLEQWKGSFQEELQQEKEKISSVLNQYHQKLQTMGQEKQAGNPDQKALTALYSSLENMEKRTDLLEEILSKLTEKSPPLAQNQPQNQLQDHLKDQLESIEERHRQWTSQMSQELEKKLEEKHSQLISLLEEKLQSPRQEPPSEILVALPSALPSAFPPALPSKETEPSLSQPAGKTQGTFAEVSAPSSPSPLSPVKMELVYQNMDQIYHNTDYREGFFAWLTSLLLKVIWGNLMRLGLELYQTLLIFWVWLGGYFHPRPGEKNQSNDEFSTSNQLVDLLKFALWIGPPLYLSHHKLYSWALVSFCGYLMVHFLISFSLSFFEWKVSLLPSAWREIRMAQYEFQRPFVDMVVLGLFLGPLIFLVIYGEFFLSAAYLMCYLGVHFILSKLGEKFGRSLSLLPSPKRKQSS